LQDGINNVTPSAVISDVGPSGMVSQNTVLHTSEGLDLFAQASDQGNALLGNLETGNFITSSQLHPFEMLA